MQQEAKNFGTRADYAERIAAELGKKIAEYERIVARYSGDLSGERLGECAQAMRDLVPRGTYQDDQGKIVRVETVVYAKHRDRATDLLVEYVLPCGKRERLPVMFFLHMHRFMWIDAAS